MCQGPSAGDRAYCGDMAASEQQEFGSFAELLEGNDWEDGDELAEHLTALVDPKGITGQWSPAEWCTTDLSERVPPT